MAKARVKGLLVHGHRYCWHCHYSRSPFESGARPTCAAGAPHDREPRVETLRDRLLGGRLPLQTMISLGRTPMNSPQTTLPPNPQQQLYRHCSVTTQTYTCF